MDSRKDVKDGFQFEVSWTAIRFVAIGSLAIPVGAALFAFALVAAILARHFGWV